MAGASFGKLFTVTTWGEPTGGSIGVIIDGVPAGVPLDENDVQSYLNRRKPVSAAFEHVRHENDFVSINSGVTQGLTNGMPVTMIITNSAVKKQNPAEADKVFRPGQDDFTFEAKYGNMTDRGRGNAVWRETAARVAAGAVAKAILAQLGISLCSYVRSIGPVSIRYSAASVENIRTNPLKMPDPKAAEEALAYLESLAGKGDSAGGVVEVVCEGVPAGIGEPVFNKLDARLAHAVMSIGLVNGVEFGEGFGAASSTGAENTDTFTNEEGKITKKTNNSGGLLGGISDGSEIILRASVAPAPALGISMKTVDASGNEIDYQNDPAETTIVPRAVVVVESMMAISLTDMIFENMFSRMDKISKFYGNND